MINITRDKARIIYNFKQDYNNIISKRLHTQPIFLLCLLLLSKRDLSVRETARRCSLSFSDQIIFPSIDRGNTGKADGSFHRTPSPFQVVKSLSQSRGCAHSRASGRRSLQEYGLLLYNK
jgi:hypothetical protein